MINLPSYIYIYGIKWTIKEVSADEIDENEILCGKQDSIKQTILINKSMTIEMKWLTLFHEVEHCIDGDLTESEVERNSGIRFDTYSFLLERGK